MGGGGWLDYSSLIPTQPSWGWGLAELGNKQQYGMGMCIEKLRSIFAKPSLRSWLESLERLNQEGSL